ncbi:uncharacterized protein METZ01_LOCUS57917 [marine metagenome]|uniref:Uncharacterized protein n=1 Tax=marine metagenome TaxID=408172 RepID=A0A381SUN8_9ZZZZ
MQSLERATRCQRLTSDSGTEVTIQRLARCHGTGMRYAYHCFTLGTTNDAKICQKACQQPLQLAATKDWFGAQLEISAATPLCLDDHSR